MLSPEEQKILIDIARDTLDAFILETKIPSFDDKSYPEALLRKAGVFVTLYKNGDLRGCVGRLHSDDALFIMVRKMTISAASRDHRFKAVTKKELDQITLEISVLSEPVKINDISEIEIPRHGIYIKKGMNSGTFLPGVGMKSGWNLEELLGHCARDKAHIGWNGWKDAEIYTYEAESFSEMDRRQTDPPG
jgi:AmmeMemoRadiSam system protein A